MAKASSSHSQDHRFESPYYPFTNLSLVPFSSFPTATYLHRLLGKPNNPDRASSKEKIPSEITRWRHFVFSDINGAFLDQVIMQLNQGSPYIEPTNCP